MPRTSYPTCTINFQTDRRMREDLHDVARLQDRSISALIRLAVRAWLDGQSPHPSLPRAYREHMPSPDTARKRVFISAVEQKTKPSTQQEER